jgi:2-keto-4-pentenoate hydratase/2-oxohepta-3-ene-1,7-dioic acid hydratase in catechol pathway
MPGDVNPQTDAGPRQQLKAGDVVEVEIGNIGIQKNYIVPMDRVTTESVHL